MINIYFLSIIIVTVETGPTGYVNLVIDDKQSLCIFELETKSLLIIQQIETVETEASQNEHMLLVNRVQSDHLLSDR